MGRKKSKQKEYDESELFQTIVVYNPYGYDEQSGSLESFMEWINVLFRPLDTKQDVIQDIYRWKGRNELLVALSPDIDISRQLGEHHWKYFWQDCPARLQDATSKVFKARYKHEDELENTGEGWKHYMQHSSTFTRHPKFVSPYPRPSMAQPPIHGLSYTIPLSKDEPHLAPEINIQKYDDPSDEVLSKEADASLKIEPGVKLKGPDRSTSLGVKEEPDALERAHDLYRASMKAHNDRSIKQEMTREEVDDSPTHLNEPGGNKVLKVEEDLEKAVRVYKDQLKHNLNESSLGIKRLKEDDDDGGRSIKKLKTGP